MIPNTANARYTLINSLVSLFTLVWLLDSILWLELLVVCLSLYVCVFRPWMLVCLIIVSLLFSFNVLLYSIRNILRLPVYSLLMQLVLDLYSFISNSSLSVSIVSSTIQYVAVTT